MADDESISPGGGGSPAMAVAPALSTTTASPMQQVAQTLHTIANSTLKTVVRTTVKLVKATTTSSTTTTTTVKPLVEVEPNLPGSPDDSPSDPQKLSPGDKFNIVLTQSIYPTDEDSHLFIYFIVGMVLCAIGYIAFHNKRKIIALILEGRQHHSETRRSGPVNYKRLNTEPPGVSIA